MTSRIAFRRRFVVLTVLAGAGLLGGCGQQAPGVAASVGGATIALDDVDAYAGAVCEYSRTSAELSGQPAQPVSGAELRSFVLDLLVQSELTDQVAATVGVSVPPSAATQQPDEQTRTVIAAMPSDEGDRVAEIYATSQRTSALQREIGTQLLAEEGTQDGTADEADQRAAQAVAAAAQKEDIEVDPRLADGYAARVSAGGGTAPAARSPLSVPASTGADGAPAQDGGDAAALGCS